FSGWSGGLSGSTNPATIVMDANKSVTATFVQPALTVQLIRPNGADSYQVGATVSVLWSTADTVAVPTVDLALSRNAHAGPFDPIGTGTSNPGSYAWTVTAPVTANAKLLVVAHDALGYAVPDTSDGAFSIIQTAAVGPAPVALALQMSPNPVREAATIRWA